MKRWENYLIITSLTAGLVGGSLAWGQQSPKPIPPTSPVPATSSTPAPGAANAVTAARININTADEATLTSVKGIGKSKAKAIIAYRDQNGPFKAVDELTKVKGIKVKSLQQFKDQITVE